QDRRRRLGAVPQGDAVRRAAPPCRRGPAARGQSPRGTGADRCGKEGRPRARRRDEPLLASRTVAVRYRARLRDARQGAHAGPRPDAALPVNAIACTRMYDVTPEVRGHWHALIAI